MVRPNQHARAGPSSASVAGVFSGDGDQYTPVQYLVKHFLREKSDIDEKGHGWVAPFGVFLPLVVVVKLSPLRLPFSSSETVKNAPLVARYASPVLSMAALAE
jgi:hypothetical protein